MNKRREIQHALATNPRAVYKALALLYRRQTLDEQQIRHTCHVNGRGFSAADAPLLTKLAERTITGGTLSRLELEAARIRLYKYTGQLEEEAALKAMRQLEATSK